MRLTSTLKMLPVLFGLLGRPALPATPPDLQFDDCHFHLTNYIQEGIGIRKFLAIMGDRVGRSVLFGIPLQQEWSYGISGDFAPKYYLDTDAPLYYYSFTDAVIAKEYLSLPPKDRKRFDPMITGFNPADMYGVEHIKRVLHYFPGVFSGIGEFSIHKEFVSSKIAGGPASLRDRSVDRILDFAGEAGLIVIIHNDVQTPMQQGKRNSVYFRQLVELFRRHPKTRIIWAHVGLGRTVQPLKEMTTAIESILEDSALDHVYFDISWDQLAKYINATPESLRKVAKLINRYPDRFLFGTDEVAPPNAGKYYKVFDLYAPLWKLLTPEASRKIRKENYVRLFDEARRKVRMWEKKHP